MEGNAGHWQFLQQRVDLTRSRRRRRMTRCLTAHWRRLEVDVKLPLPIAAVDATLAETDPSTRQGSSAAQCDATATGLRPIYERALST